MAFSREIGGASPIWVADTWLGVAGADPRGEPKFAALAGRFFRRCGRFEVLVGCIGAAGLRAGSSGGVRMESNDLLS
jgi:hypothetical protein